MEEALKRVASLSFLRKLGKVYVGGAVLSKSLKVQYKRF